MNKDSHSMIRSLVCSLGIAAAMLSASTARADTSTGAVYLQSIKATTNSTSGNIFYAMSTAWPSGEGCDSTQYILIVKGSTNYDTLNKMLYDAYINNRAVTFTLSGCQSVGTVSYPAIKDFTEVLP